MALPHLGRPRRLRWLQRRLRRYPVVGLLGARQVGKSTLARELARAAGGAALFDLEDPRDVARLEDPMLALQGGRRRLGFEFKRTTAPEITRSMRVALQDLKLSSLDVVHAGEHTFPLDRRVRAVALRRILSDLEPLS